MTITGDLGFPVPEFFCLGSSLFGVWRRATPGTGITHAARSVFYMVYHVSGRVPSTCSGSIQHKGDGISVPGYYRDVCSCWLRKIRGRYSDTIA